MLRFSEKIESCGLSPMRKFHPLAQEARARGVRIYNLNIGQPDIETPRVYYEAAFAQADRVLSYAPSPGIPKLIDAVCRYYGRLGAHLTEDDVLVTTGGSEALSILMPCILNEGDEVIVPEPFYPNYNSFIRATGGVICPLTTCPEEGYRFAVRARIEGLINARTRAILLSNPGNPTGTVLSPEELRLIADIAKERGLYLIVDEVYREFVYGGEPLSTALTLSDMDEHVVLIDSVSKRFSACGARIGMLISRNHALLQHALKLCQARLSVASLDQAGSTALYGMEASYFDAVREEYRLRRDTIYQKLLEIPGVVCAEPKGAFYLMAKLPVDDADLLQTFLLREFDDAGETLMFAPGAGFYATPGAGRNEVRLAYVLNAPELSRSMEILRAGIKAYNAR